MEYNPSIFYSSTIILTISHSYLNKMFVYVRTVVLLSLQKKLSIRVSIVFENLVGKVFLGVKAIIC